MNKMFKFLITLLLIGLVILVFSNSQSYILSILEFVKGILLPFFISFVLAYILNPIVSFFEKFLKKRKYAVFVTLLLFACLIIVFVRMTFPFIQNELSELSIRLPDILATLEDKVNEFADNFSFLPEEIRPNFDNLKNILMNYIEKIDISKLFNNMIFHVGNVIIIPVILIYLLADYENILNRFRNYLIKKDKLHFKEYLSKLNEFFSRYIKTTILVIFLLVFIATITFTVIGLDYPLFFGSIIGITNIIPYFGPYIGGAFPVLYALTNSVSKMIAVLVSIVIIQLLESCLLTPYLHSKNSKTHPLLVILSLSVCGALFGVLGMIFAVPILKFVEITIKYYPLYKIIFKKKENKV